MTATAVSSLPFALLSKSGDVVDSSKDWKNKAGGVDDPRRLLYLLASSLCGGAAYLRPYRTTQLVMELQYLVPHSVQPRITRNGLEKFERTTDDGKREAFKPTDLIYFWLPDSDVEIGPAQNTPLSNARMDAEVILSGTNTMKLYGERGWVPIMALGAKGMPDEVERAKTENFFDRLLRGGFKERAKVINAEALSVVKIGAGMEDLKQSYEQIKRESREAIATAFGIPSALFMSDNAFASEFAMLTRQWYTASRFRSIDSRTKIFSHHQAVQGYRRPRLSPPTICCRGDRKLVSVRGKNILLRDRFERGCCRNLSLPRGRG